eukprot:Lankesteria_metandrocarpae@DN178_c0_g1_i1.p1
MRLAVKRPRESALLAGPSELLYPHHHPPPQKVLLTPSSRLKQQLQVTNSTNTLYGAQTAVGGSVTVPLSRDPSMWSPEAKRPRKRRPAPFNQNTGNDNTGGSDDSSVWRKWLGNLPLVGGYFKHQDGTSPAITGSGSLAHNSRGGTI